MNIRVISRSRQPLVPPQMRVTNGRRRLSIAAWIVVAGLSSAAFLLPAVFHQDPSSRGPAVLALAFLQGIGAISTVLMMARATSPDAAQRPDLGARHWKRAAMCLGALSVLALAAPTVQSLESSAGLPAGERTLLVRIEPAAILFAITAFGLYFAGRQCAATAAARRELSQFV